MNRSSLLAPAAAWALVAGMLGCSQNPAPAAAPQQAPAPEPEVDRSVAVIADQQEETPVTGDWLLTRMPAEMPHLNPVTSTDGYASRIMAFIFEGLIEIDPKTLEPKPLVAERWEVSEDHLVYTFYLRKDARFSDGQPVTAHDVKFSFDKVMDPAVDAAHIRSYFVDLEKYEVLDDHTIRFTCTKPFWQHINYIGQLEILPKHLYENGDFNTHPMARTPVGSGPYTLEKWDTNQQIVLARNPSYWNAAAGQTGYIDKWVYKLITDDNAAFQVLNSGDLDICDLRPHQWVGEAAKPEFEARFNKKSWYSPFYNYIGWNSRRPMFADKRVRRALTMLTDRETMRQTIWEGLAQTVSSGFLPGTPEHNDAIKPWPYDPAQANALLDEAGWKDTDGDGLRDKDGVPFRFELLIVTAAPEAEQTATIMKEEFQRAGIELNILALEWATMIERVHARKMDAFMLGWSMPPFPDEYQLWHSSQIDSGSNYVGFNNPEADKIIEDARITFDAEERNKLFHRFHEIMHEEQPYTFLFSPSGLLAVDKRVCNTVVYPQLRNRPRFEWFVPTELQRYGK